MPRKRFVSPGFFTNEDLACCPALARIAFMGLLCHADREGLLEDRPARLKALILPYDDCDFDGLLDRLHSGHFILRYQVSGLKLIAIPKFLKYQSPHPREPQSVLTPPHTAASGAQVARNGPGHTNSNMPESVRSQEDPEGQEDPETEAPEDLESTVAPARAKYSAAFEEWYAAYPRKVEKGKASTAYGRAVSIVAGRGMDRKQARDWLLGITRLFADSPAGQAGQFVPYPASWLNGNRFDDDQNEWQRNQGDTRGKSSQAERHNSAGKYAEPGAGTF